MEYQNITQVRQAFKSGKLDIPEDLYIDGIRYHYNSSKVYPFDEMIERNVKPVVVYTTARKNIHAAKERGLNESIVFIWSFKEKNLTMQPLDVRLTTQARFSSHDIYEADEDNIIGDTAEVKFSNFPTPLTGRVDTGASMCCLHADEWKVLRDDSQATEGGKVQFRSQPLSNNVITMDMVTTMAVKTPDGGVEYRPVVNFNIRIGNKFLKDVTFNLNNRSEMDLPVLIGQNALEKGNFLIDPKKSEIKEDEEDGNVDWQQINNLTLDIETDDSDVANIYEMLKDSNVSFSDLFDYCEKKSRE